MKWYWNDNEYDTREEAAQAQADYGKPTPPTKELEELAQRIFDAAHQQASPISPNVVASAYEQIAIEMKQRALSAEQLLATAVMLLTAVEHGPNCVWCADKDKPQWRECAVVSFLKKVSE